MGGASMMMQAQQTQRMRQQMMVQMASQNEPKLSAAGPKPPVEGQNRAGFGPKQAEKEPGWPSDG